MIKKLHYVWFGGKPLPKNVLSCIASWRRYCPDWEIVRWDETNFDVNAYRWTREALQARKFAFAADFVRLWALECFGGGYLDTDVQLFRPLDDSIRGDFCTAIENHHVGTDRWDVHGHCVARGYEDRVRFLCIQAGFLYAEPHHPFVVQCMAQLYDNGQRAFLKADGGHHGFVIDAHLWLILHSDYGLALRDETQQLKDNIVVYDSSVYATRKTHTRHSYLVHWFDQTWRKDEPLALRLKTFIKQRLYRLYRFCCLCRFCRLR